MLKLSTLLALGLISIRKSKFLINFNGMKSQLLHVK